MNIEDEKPTHIDKDGDYWLIKSNDEAYFKHGEDGEWHRYKFPVYEYIASGCIKPLSGENQND